MKNAADAARHLRRAIGGTMTEAGKDFPQIPRLEPFVLSENASFLWFGAASDQYPIPSTLDLPFERA
jgi:hypothetical protein